MDCQDCHFISAELQIIFGAERIHLAHGRLFTLEACTPRCSLKPCEGIHYSYAGYRVSSGYAHIRYHENIIPPLLLD